MFHSSWLFYITYSLTFAIFLSSLPKCATCAYITADQVPSDGDNLLGEKGGPPITCVLQSSSPEVVLAYWDFWIATSLGAKPVLTFYPVIISNRGDENMFLPQLSIFPGFIYQFHRPGIDRAADADTMPTHVFLSKSDAVPLLNRFVIWCADSRRCQPDPFDFLPANEKGRHVHNIGNPALLFRRNIKNVLDQGHSSITDFNRSLIAELFQGCEHTVFRSPSCEDDVKTTAYKQMDESSIPSELGFRKKELIVHFPVFDTLHSRLILNMMNPSDFIDTYWFAKKESEPHKACIGGYISNNTSRTRSGNAAMVVFEEAVIAALTRTGPLVNYIVKVQVRASDGGKPLLFIKHATNGSLDREIWHSVYKALFSNKVDPSIKDVMTVWNNECSEPLNEFVVYQQLLTKIPVFGCSLVRLDNQQLAKLATQTMKSTKLLVAKLKYLQTILENKVGLITLGTFTSGEIVPLLHAFLAQQASLNYIGLCLNAISEDKVVLAVYFSIDRTTSTLDLRIPLDGVVRLHAETFPNFQITPGKTSKTQVLLVRQKIPSMPPTFLPPTSWSHSLVAVKSNGVQAGKNHLGRGSSPLATHSFCPRDSLSRTFASMSISRSIWSPGTDENDEKEEEYPVPPVVSPPPFFSYESSNMQGPHLSFSRSSSSYSGLYDSLLGSAGKTWSLSRFDNRKAVDFSHDTDGLELLLDTSTFEINKKFLRLPYEISLAMINTWIPSVYQTLKPGSYFAVQKELFDTEAFDILGALREFAVLLRSDQQFATCINGVSIAIDRQQILTIIVWLSSTKEECIGIVKSGLEICAHTLAPISMEDRWMVYNSYSLNKHE